MVAVLSANNPPPVPPLSLSKPEIARIFNALGGAQIRWNDSQQGFTTIAGDRFPDGDVEDVVAGLLKMQQR
jgi:hypothetical protein